MPFRELPARLRALITAKTALAAVLLAFSWSAGPPPSWGLLALLVVCGMVGSAFKVDAHVQGLRITMGFIVTYFSFFLLGPLAAMLVSIAGTIAALALKVEGDQRRFTPERLVSYRTVYNCANGVVSIAAMSVVYVRLGGTFGHVQLQNIAVPSLASALAYYLTSGAGAALAIAWARQRSPVEVFLNYCASAWAGFLASASISIALLWGYQTLHHSTVALLAIPPAFLIYYTFVLRSDQMRREIDHMQELGRLNDSIITSLAMAIDAKDQHTSKHTSRVREYAISLAEKLNVSRDELEAVRIASLLHDVGKIGIPESILCKPGKLTPEEFEVIKSHVQIGAAILEQINFPWPVVPIVLGHHERWDGMGYPNKLSGEEIPIGARIISLVDVFDALTSERPYRKAMSREQAIGMLRSGAGTQFDPVVVETFIELLPALEARVQAILDAGEAAPAVPHVQAPAAPAHDPAADAVAVGELIRPVMDAPAGAFLHRLGEKLPDLVPFTSLALFLPDPERGCLAPAHHSGLWAPLFDGLEIRLGEGISGYVAETGETTVNAAAALDLARRIKPGENLELNSTLCVPLLRDGKPCGALTLYHSSYNFYQPHHLRRLQQVAEVVARLQQLKTAAPLQPVVSPAPRTVGKDGPEVVLPSGAGARSVAVAGRRQPEASLAGPPAGGSGALAGAE